MHKLLIDRSKKICLINCSQKEDELIVGMSYFAPRLKADYYEVGENASQPLFKIEIPEDFCNPYPTVITQCQNYLLVSKVLENAN